MFHKALERQPFPVYARDVAEAALFLGVGDRSTALTEGDIELEGPLAGIRVLEFAALMNGPVAVSMLGDLGADVVKIEEPGKGDPFRGFQTMFGSPMRLAQGRSVNMEHANRSKRSITLNLKTEKGKDLFYEMVKRTDVFVTNYNQEVLEGLAIDYETLRRYNARLIYAHSSAYGLLGPDADQRGFDTTGQARSGLMWAMGDRDSPEPALVVGGIMDKMSGTMLAYAVLAAIVARERLGTGQRVDVSMLSAALHFQAHALLGQLAQGKSHARHSRTRIGNPMANYYRCSDSKWLMLSEPQSQRYWPEFCEACGIQQFENDPKFENAEARRKNAPELIKIFDSVFMTRPLAEWLQRFASSRCRFAYSPVLNYADVVVDPQVVQNEYITEFDHPALGKIRHVGCPIKFSETPVVIVRAAPELGEHTEEILLENGYSWEDISGWKDGGVI